jgi:hypothetical protein
MVDRASISDTEFLKTLEAKDFHKVLDEDAILLVGLTVRPEKRTQDKLKHLLRSYGDLWRELGTTTLDSDYSYDTHFVEIRLAGLSYPLIFSSAKMQLEVGASLRRFSHDES